MPFNLNAEKQSFLPQNRHLQQDANSYQNICRSLLIIAQTKNSISCLMKFHHLRPFEHTLHATKPDNPHLLCYLSIHDFAYFTRTFYSADFRIVAINLYRCIQGVRLYSAEIKFVYFCIFIFDCKAELLEFCFFCEYIRRR